MTARENVIRTIRCDAPEWIPYRYDGCITMIKPDIAVRPDSTGKDVWGVQWLAAGKDGETYPDNVPVINIEDIREYHAPATDWSKILKQLEIKVKNSRIKDTLIIVYDELPLFERMQLLLGYSQFMVSLKTEEELFNCLLDIITDYQEKLVAIIMNSGADGIRFTDDWGMQDRLFISPSDWRKFFKPRYQKLYGVVKKKNGIIFQHSCGCIEDIVPDIIELGADVLDPCQPGANDIFAWKHKCGKHLSFMGGLDTQGYLSFGSPDEVKKQVKKVAATMGEGGGYIAAPSHTIEIPFANRQAMIDAINEINMSKYNSNKN